MPSHPDRVRRAYTPGEEPQMALAVDPATGDVLVSLRVSRALQEIASTDSERRELLRLVRHRLARALER